MSGPADKAWGGARKPLRIGRAGLSIGKPLGGNAPADGSPGLGNGK
jgi:hypothetical protein